MPLPEFIEHLYFKSFGKSAPDGIVSIEDRVKEIERKKKDKRERRYDSPTIAAASDPLR